MSERIAVFRALVLGDVLCAVPALRALRRGFPGAEITLIGLPWAETLAQRLPQVDRFIAFPGHPAWPEATWRPADWPAFLAEMQARRFDLLLQLHGSGGVSNVLAALFGARRLAAFRGPGAWLPDDALAVPWPERGHEIERCLALTDALGVERAGPALEFPLVQADREAALALVGDAPYAVLHPGAQLRSRRWPVERFAAVGDRLAARGLRVVVTGTEGELAAALAAAMRRPPLDLAGRTTLWQLGALIEGARVVVCNDTGVSHVAAATRTPSVVVACGSDVRRWSPLDRQRHRVLWHDVPCRPCGHECCPTSHECALGVDVARVAEAAAALLEQESPCPADCAS